MRVSKFVLDTNIYISYFITKRQNVIFKIIKENKISIFSCEELFIELRRVLTYLHLGKYNIYIHQAIIATKAITIYRTVEYPIKKYLPLDSDDDYLIALALQTNSGYVTSGDKHILSEKENLESKYKKATDNYQSTI